jgi:hypothetical protein
MIIQCVTRRWFALPLAAFVFWGSVCSAEPFEAFVTQHCIRCHGTEKEEGDFRVDLLSRDFASGTDSHHWAEALDKVNSGEMPPLDQPQPTQKEIAGFVTSLNSRLQEGRAARMAARPAVAHYRLSRKEYQNTVYDLLGVRYDPTQPGELNEDTLWHGYERIGSELSLSPSHVDRFYRAADVVLDRAFSPVSAESRTVRKTAAELRYGGGSAQQVALERLGIKRPLRYLIFPGRIQTALSPGWFGKTGPEHSGLYKVRIQASGIRPAGGQPAHLSIGKATGASGDTVSALIEFDVTAPEDSPEVYEFEVMLEMPTNLDFCVVATDMIDDRKGGAFRGALTSREGYIFTHSSEPLLLNPNAPQMFDDKGNGLFSTVILDWIQWEGPIVTEAETSKRRGILPPDDGTMEVVADHLLGFAQRAWRRPVMPEELQDYLQSYQDERDAGETLVDAFKIALQGVLTSRHFIYLVEGDSVPRQRLSDWELASRLSYFLWSSMPDNDLFAAADSGDLCAIVANAVEPPADSNPRPSRLEVEVDRMLSDNRINRFIDDFPRQWLQLHRVGMFPPDKKIFPGYDDWLEASMRREVVEYFRETFIRNLNVESFIDSDWTIANARLCDFYGLPEPTSGDFQRIALQPEDQRGGLLTMGAVLGLTSDGTRHRPVHRGVWLSEAIFNRTPPAPPANVDPIAPVPPEGEKLTIRKRLASHAQNANCASCHRNIDPLGFAFDQYDAIGQWRTHEHVDGGKGDNPLVNASGVLPDGREFSDANHFKQRLLEDIDKFRHAFIEHLCTYALRRVLTIDDAEDIISIVNEAKTNNYGIRDMVRSVALSELMKKR